MADMAVSSFLLPSPFYFVVDQSFKTNFFPLESGLNFCIVFSLSSCPNFYPIK
ncbi:hypothetical protein RchiOBHm_Chr2g0150771 [Rosa chinensis]|uniref:Uncharacterized protein n=1 Tax=Rosa chinensis TaxID=74649 RepID=A0A2P6RZZ7_ROSCH|nr:hypothetical protein RchiOBHm_Chr2g0150771 [Rosa chinensis]